MENLHHFNSVCIYPKYAHMGSIKTRRATCLDEHNCSSSTLENHFRHCSHLCCSLSLMKATKLYQITQTPLTKNGVHHVLLWRQPYCWGRGVGVSDGICKEGDSSADVNTTLRYIYCCLVFLSLLTFINPLKSKRKIWSARRLKKEI